MSLLLGSIIIPVNYAMINKLEVLLKSQRVTLPYPLSLYLLIILLWNNQPLPTTLYIKHRALLLATKK